MAGGKRNPFLAFLLGRNRRRGEGLDATWWAVTSLCCFVAGIGGLVKGIWWAAVFFIPAVPTAVVAVRRAREGNY